jgi:cyclopropane-fatty-acyl-phospholipid synthase
MNPALLPSTIVHRRCQPFSHVFHYPALMICLNLDDLDSLDPLSPLLRINRRAPFSVFESDYLLPGEGRLADRVRAFVNDRTGAPVADCRILLVTCPKMFGWGFNPVSFYLCVGFGGDLQAVIAEVNNTFGERHLYYLDPQEAEREGEIWHFSTPKVFHVSPFFAREGEYRFHIRLSPDSYAIDIDLWQGEERVIHTRMTGKSLPLTTTTLKQAILRQPLVRLLTYPRILKEAAVLYYQKKAQLWHRPAPCHDDTTTHRKLSLTENFGLRVVRALLKRLEKGRIDLRLHDGSWETFRGASPGTECRVIVRDPAFYRSVVFGGDVGFGESYTRAEWDSPDVTKVIECLIENRESMGEYRIPFASILERMNRFRHALRKNSLRKSRQNIADHYDLGNDLFSKFLDPSMTYSCAYYANSSTSLEQAQEAKLGMILSRADIRDGDKVLEIGSGWGSFVIAAARHRTCQLLTTTLSKNQYDVVRQRIAEHNLAHRVSARLSDYRQLAGEKVYDKIVSIEMFEAVGYQYWGQFFAVCDRLLKEDGRIVMQIITLPDRYFSAYKHGCDWIQKHIFPGGFLPSIGALRETLKKSTPFSIVELEDIGIHYARTLRDWRERFHREKAALLAKGYSEEFFRKWDYYFCYCEAAFQTETLGVHHLVLERRR